MSNEEENIQDISSSSSTLNSSICMTEDYLVEDDWMFLGKEPPVSSVPVRLHVNNIPFRYK